MKLLVGALLAFLIVCLLWYLHTGYLTTWRPGILTADGLCRDITGFVRIGKTRIYYPSAPQVAFDMVITGSIILGTIFGLRYILKPDARP